MARKRPKLKIVPKPKKAVKPKKVRLPTPSRADDETKENAYEVYLKNRRNLRATARELGVSRSTLQGWIETVELRRRVVEASETPSTVTKAPAAGLGLMALAEYVTREILLEMLVKIPRERAPALGQRAHVLLHDLRMLAGEPTSINRTENLTSQALDLTALNPDELIKMAEFLRRCDPRSRVKYTSGEPVILDGIEDDDAPALDAPT